MIWAGRRDELYRIGYRYDPRGSHDASIPLWMPALAALTLTHIMTQKYIAQWAWAHVELWMDMRRYHYVDIDPALFDRDVMAETYDTYIDQLVYGEECGFDAICVNEHHSNGYGLMPSPNLIASILARRRIAPP